MTPGTDRFFAFARERHNIWMRRDEGLPRPWTQDPILDRYRFTNVFRELDRTTQWWRKISDEIRGPEVLLATVIFRWFNRVTTGEAIFCDPDILTGKTTFEKIRDEVGTIPPYTNLPYIQSGDFEQHIRDVCGAGPYVTGAYIIKTPDGYSKLAGVIKCIEWFIQNDMIVPDSNNGKIDQRELSNHLWNFPGKTSLETVWKMLRTQRYLGDFMAYEIVTDLRHTQLLDKAPDIMTWANPGPGATRGCGRIVGGNPKLFNQHGDKKTLITIMQELLEWSQHVAYWPSYWPKWEMREVEHTLCEFDKYERVRLGEGRPRGVYS